ncbi:hypothetical protein SKAU_G00409550, partial [Synaphobranchus kaupii]
LVHSRPSKPILELPCSVSTRLRVCTLSRTCTAVSGMMTVGATGGFEQYGYDGEDFLIFDLKNLRFISPTPQGGY